MLWRQHLRAAGGRLEAAMDYRNIDAVVRTDVVDVPLVGRIAAGTPILADQNVEDSSLGACPLCGE